MIRKPLIAAVALCAIPAAVLASNVTIPHIFSAGRVASAAEVNANFNALAVAVNDIEPRTLSATQHATLTGGGNADALHRHSGATAPMKLRVAQAYNTTAAARLVDAQGRGSLVAIKFEALTNMTIRVTIDGDTAPSQFTASSSMASGNVYELPLGQGFAFGSSLQVDAVPAGAGASLSNLLVVYGVE